MRTNDLRKLIQIKLDSIKAEYGITDVFYQYSKPDAMFPHIVFSFDRVNSFDFHRKDYMVDIDIYSKIPVIAFNIADAIENIFIFSNDPQSTILPTFFMENRIEVEDPDKSIRHIVIRMQTQLYVNK